MEDHPGIEMLLSSTRPLREKVASHALYVSLETLEQVRLFMEHLGCALFAQYAGFPGILWGVVPSILAAFAAYGRIALKPF